MVNKSSQTSQQPQPNNSKKRKAKEQILPTAVLYDDSDDELVHDGFVPAQQKKQISAPKKPTAPKMLSKVDAKEQALLDATQRNPQLPIEIVKLLLNPTKPNILNPTKPNMEQSFAEQSIKPITATTTAAVAPSKSSFVPKSPFAPKATTNTTPQVTNEPLTFKEACARNPGLRPELVKLLLNPLAPVSSPVLRPTTNTNTNTTATKEDKMMLLLKKAKTDEHAFAELCKHNSLRPEIVRYMINPLIPALPEENLQAQQTSMSNNDVEKVDEIQDENNIKSILTPSFIKANPNLTFLLGGCKASPSGFTVDKLLARFKNKDYAYLERAHDYIQWAFTITEPGMNPNAPPLSTVEFNAYNNLPSKIQDIIKKKVLFLLKGMCDFWGVDYNIKKNIFQRQNQNATTLAKYLNTHGTHNSLRISRIIKSLFLFDLADVALEFLRFWTTQFYPIAKNPASDEYRLEMYLSDIMLTDLFSMNNFWLDILYQFIYTTPIQLNNKKSKRLQTKRDNADDNNLKQNGVNLLVEKEILLAKYVDIMVQFSINIYSKGEYILEQQQQQQQIKQKKDKKQKKSTDNEIVSYTLLQSADESLLNDVCKEHKKLFDIELNKKMLREKLTTSNLDILNNITSIVKNAIAQASSQKLKPRAVLKAQFENNTLSNRVFAQ